jgi:hypothetical protein
MRTRISQHGTDSDHARSGRSRQVIGRSSPIARHPIVSFFVLAYAIAWAPLPLGTFAAIGPFAAALVVIAVTDPRHGFRDLAGRVLKWRVSWQWYAAAVALPLGTLIVSSAANMALGAPSPSLTQFTPWYAVPMMFALNLVNPLGGQLGEEPGWRGFALPGLQVSRSPFAATAILAVLVTGWHVPLMLPAFGLRPIELLSTVAVTFWYSWLFNRSGGSALITLISHSVEGSLETSTLWSGADATRLITIWALVATTIVLSLLAVDRRFWFSDPSDRGSRQ